jgi:predicted DNA-binding transcriptional regulator AlpA
MAPPAKLYKFKDQLLPMKEIAAVTGTHIVTAYRNYGDNKKEKQGKGWKKNQLFYAIDGVKYSMKELAERLGTTPGILYSLHAKKTEEEFLALIKDKLDKPGGFTQKTSFIIDGVSYTVNDLVKLIGVSRQFIHFQYKNKSKENFDRWVKRKIDGINETLPAKPTPRIFFTVNGVKYDTNELAELIGVSKSLIYHNYKIKSETDFHEWIETKVFITGK